MTIEKDKALTPDKKQILIGQVELEIENINKAIRQGGLPSGVLEAVKANRDSLQGVLNRLFEKKGVITPQETNKTIFSLDKSKNDRLQIDFQRNMKRVAIFVGLLLALVIGYTLYTKSKNRQ